MNIVHLTSVVEFMRLLLPEIQVVISEIENDGGYLNFSESLTALATKDGLRPWSAFYDKPQSINGIVARFLYDKDELAELERKFQASSPEQAEELRRDIQHNILAGMRELETDQSEFPITEDQTASMWASMDPATSPRI